MDREHPSGKTGIARGLDRMAGAITAKEDDMSGRQETLDVPSPCRRDLL
jgi:hypothetical protein